MELTTTVLSQFVRGQIEIQNPVEGYIFRGEIRSVLVRDGMIRVTMNWLAKGTPYPGLPNRWVNSPEQAAKGYVATLEIYSVGEIEPCPERGKRLVMTSSTTGETVAFFTADASRLDRSKVEGLV